MNYFKNILLITLAILSYSIIGKAQVKFKLQLLNDEKTYQVSLIPEASYRPPLNMTSTAQVTIKVPTGSFEISNMRSLQPQVEWESNSIAVAPSESEEYDYISFGLINNGTEFLRYETGVELPIFTFENKVACTGEILLMDNANDPFMPPNSVEKNVGNQITIAGAGGDAYVGNAIKSSVLCGQLSTSVADLENENVVVDIFPNPTSDELNLAIKGDLSLSDPSIIIYDILGKAVFSQKITLEQGNISIQLPTSQLVKGHYLLELSGKEGKWTMGQFVKAEK